MASSPVSRAVRLIAAASALSLATNPLSAGLNKGSVTVDWATVYLGVVPAEQARDYASEGAGEMQMASATANAAGSVHLVVALFDHGSGKRITDARVKARFLGERGRRWSVMLEPMTMNGAMSYGAYSTLGGNKKTSIFIDVARPLAGRTQTMTARFEYTED
jgi:hypothetical protein